MAETKDNKSNPKRKSYHRNRKNYRKEDKTYEDKGYRGGSPNDPKWYVSSGQLASDVASFSFNNPLGVPVEMNMLEEAYVEFPGIMSILTAPSVGITAGNNDKVAPVNMAAQNIYSYVRHQNSGHANYDPSDYMIYLMAMDSLYSFISWLTRIYGVTRTYSMMNRYVGNGFLEAMGIMTDAGTTQTANQTVQHFLSDLRAYINFLITKASTFAVPNTMSYYLRHYWMYSGIYKDEDVSKAQFYMYNPAYLYKFALDSDGKGALQPVWICATYSSTLGAIRPKNKFNDNRMSLNGLINLGDQILGALLYQEDIGIMSGDTLKAFGESGLYHMSLIPEDYSVTPMFSEEVLLQIHNTHFVGNAPKDEDSLWVKQNVEVGSGTIVFTPYFRTNEECAGYNRTFLDTWKETVTPEDVMVMTRNTIKLSAPDTDGYSFISTAGSDFALFANMITYEPNFGFNSWEEYFETPTPEHIQARLSRNLGIFNLRPIRSVIQNGVPIGIDGEVSNYVVIDEGNLRRIHDCALLAMLGVPYTKW